MLMLVACVVKSSANDPLPVFLPSVKSAKGLVLPIGSDSAKPTMRFSCGSVQMERKSLGFLRIGVLPQLVFEDVELRITDSADSKKWAQELKSFFLTNSSSATAQIKGFRVLPAVGEGSVSASRARFDFNSQSLVLESVEAKLSHGNTISHSQGLLHLEGVDAGRLSLPALKDQTISLTGASVILSPGSSAKSEVSAPPIQ